MGPWSLIVQIVSASEELIVGGLKVRPFGESDGPGDGYLGACRLRPSPPTLTHKVLAILPARAANGATKTPHLSLT